MTKPNHQHPIHGSKRRRLRRQRPRKPCFRFEVLEDRALLATFTVTHTADSGAGSLRQAIFAANANGNPDTIEFNIPTSDPGFVDVDSGMPGGDGAADAFVIQPLSALPALTDNETTIDGHTQTTFTGDTNPFGPEIVLDGGDLPDAALQTGLFIFSNDNEVFGLNIQQFPSIGIDVRGNSNWIAGNYIGTDATGTIARANGFGAPGVDSGISLGTTSVAANMNVIGTDGNGVTDEAERNVISGNGIHGVIIRNGDQNVLAGNFVGTNAAGSQPLPNGANGVTIQGGSDLNRIGADGSNDAFNENERNVISGNVNHGVNINIASGNIVAGNYIGVNATGDDSLGNGGDGVRLENASSNRIGTNGDGVADSAERNIISGNSQGLGFGGNSSNNVVAGNYIGTNATGLGNSGVGVQFGFGLQYNRIGADGNGVADDAERNIISGNGSHGIEIFANDNTVAGNYIGVDITGAKALSNAGDGVRLLFGASGNFIGTDSDGVADDAERNIISGNGMWGVLSGAGASGNFVAGNYIGADVTGAGPVPNGSGGVVLVDVQGNLVGTDGDGVADDAERNIISGNAGPGVLITRTAAPTDGNVVAGNYIGTDVSGASPLGNSEQGVQISGGAQDNQIGADGDGAGDGAQGNIIAFNAGHGVEVLDTASTGNSIRSNGIHSNGGIGIDLGGDGVTPNDEADPDTGPNQFQNHPQLAAVAGGLTTSIAGILNSSPNMTFTIEFFANTVIDPSGIDEGQRFLGATTVTTDIFGNGLFDVQFAVATNNGDIITATATDPMGNTSEFSRPPAFVVSPGTFIVTNTNDDGPGSLRRAITRANAFPGANSILFAIPTTDPGFVDVDSALAGGDAAADAFVIEPLSALPALSDDDGTTIDGRTQTDFGGDTNPFGPEIVIHGSLAETDGLQIFSDNNAVFGLNIQGFSGNGVLISGGDNNRVSASYIGVDATGTVGMANGLHGVLISAGAQSNVIGAEGDGAEGNVISFNGADGVAITDAGTDFNVVAGNLIGTDASGTLALGNGSITGDEGVSINLGAKFNRIGTNGDGIADAAERNIIAANSAIGVFIQHVGSDHNIVAGNFIGTDITGTVALGNGADGVRIAFGARFNLIGADGDGVADAAERNVISGNAQRGIRIQDTGTTNNVVAGNYIGVDALGSTPLANGLDGIFVFAGASNNLIGADGDGIGDAAERNVISGNALDGIRIQNTGTTNNVVAGNFIGTDATGTAALANLRGGVRIQGGAQFNVIGANGDGVGDEAKRNVISGNAQDGVHLNGAGTDNNTVAGNYIGVDVTGAAPLGNTSRGVQINNGARLNRIGTNSDGVADVLERNVISSNLTGVLILNGSNENIVAGNYIGTDASGTAALGNTFIGVWITAFGSNVAGQANLVGTNGDGAADDVEGNLISGNTFEGVSISDQIPGADANIVAGNIIGADASGLLPLGNTGHGVLIEQGQSNRIGASGGPASGAEANTIAFNGLAGVAVIGDAAAGNLLRGNSIHSNGGLGIDLGADGLTAGDAGPPPDDDSGPNQLQNFPVLSAVGAGATTRTVGNLNSGPNQSYTVDFYASAARDPTGYGEGQRHLGSTIINTDAAGNASFDVTLPEATSAGEFVTATATDSANNTSEFSGAFFATGTGSILTGGGPDDDLIQLTPGSTPDTINVTVNGIDLGDFPAQPIVAFGFEGNDVIVVDPAITQPVQADGGEGDDTLQGSGGDDTLIGGEGDDILDGGPGGDTMDGGRGSNTIISDASDDLGEFSLTIVSPISLTPDSTVVRGQTITFAVTFPDTGSNVAWDFGDGNVGDGAQVGNAYSENGAYTVTVTITDSADASTTFHRDVQITTTAIQQDAADADQTALAVGGTAGDNVILVTKALFQEGVKVFVNMDDLGLFEPTGRLLLYGQGQNDLLTVSALVNLPAWLYGNGGNDILKGGSGPDVLLGEAGNDLLMGGIGRDLLVGGTGKDLLFGGWQDDILIAGYLDFADRDAALSAVMAEWTSDRDYTARVRNLTDGTGSQERLNGDFFLVVDETVKEDEDFDLLIGGFGRDWFFLDLEKDKVLLRSSSEVIGNDLDVLS